MGLDMYLSAELYVGGQFIARKVTGKCQISMEEWEGPVDVLLDAEDIEYIVMPAIYWRKANAIHKWFVDNIQDGVDNCQRAELSRDDLIRLRDLCAEALKNEDTSLLPPQSGFFFGSTEIDEWYWKDLEYTVIKIDEALNNSNFNNCSFVYRSSW